MHCRRSVAVIPRCLWMDVDKPARPLAGAGRVAPCQLKSCEEGARRPVSRVLSDSPSRGRRDGHSSGTRIAARLARPTRATGRNCPRVSAPSFPRVRHAGRPYSVLLPVGFALPPLLPGARCALAAPFRPCPRGTNPCTGGLFSVALSLGSPPPAVSRHRISVEPGLSSTRVAPGSGRPAVWQAPDAPRGARGQAGAAMPAIVRARA